MKTICLRRWMAVVVRDLLHRIKDAQKRSLGRYSLRNKTDPLALIHKRVRGPLNSPDENHAFECVQVKPGEELCLLAEGRS